MPNTRNALCVLNRRNPPYLLLNQEEIMSYWNENEYGDLTRDPQESSFIRQISGAIAVLSFLADILLQTILLGTLLDSKWLSSAQPVHVQYLLVIVVYLFALGLFVYARPAYEDRFDFLVYLLGWIFVFLGAALMATIARIFVIQPGFGFFDFLIYAAAAAFSASFGIIIAFIVGERTRPFALPFLLVALWQVVLWVWRVLSSQSVAGGWNLVGSLSLFFFTIFLIILLTRTHKRREPNGL